MELSLLKQERLKRGWSRAKVEALTERKSFRSLLKGACLYQRFDF